MKYPYRYSDLEGNIETSYIPIEVDDSNQEYLIEISLPYTTETSVADSNESSPYPNMPPVNEAEILRRLPEIQLIQEEHLQTQVIDIIKFDFPSYYWTVPATGSRKHHPVDERVTHGQWIHTKRVIGTFDHISKSARSLSDYVDSLNSKIEFFDYRMSEFEYACGLTASILHDIHKFGDSEYPSNRMEPDHDVTGGEYLADHYDLPKMVVGCIESHNGPWGDGKPPETSLELFVHLSDMIAADYKSEFLLIEPTPEIIYTQIRTALKNSPDIPENYTIKFDNKQRDVITSE